MRNLRTGYILTGLVVSSLWAQEAPLAKKAAHPVKPPQVTHIRFILSSGMCYGYCMQELDVEQGQAILLNHSQGEDKNKCPDLKVTADFSDKHWKELVQLIDREALFALPERIGCPGCVDQVIEHVEVRFSDHTKRGVSYNLGDTPKEIKTLSAKLAALEAKLANEIPPISRCVL